MKLIKRAIAAISLCLGLGVQAQTTYNAVATAYVTTTISQSVVFDSTMQAGGTFEFSVLAHNGGGRAGQSDTANVKIQFYTSSNTLVSTVNTNYSGNLPQPTQSGSVNSQGVTLSGNPQADPAVPWTTLSISSTNCGGSCATVAYAKVTMYGIDGSYWAGDYGPWYRAPTLTLNGGGNLLYNPEFGPYNGTNVQGWTLSPALGACQGAWGGSNACIVDNNGVPGQNTVGLTANQNGGGPSATGGTTSGTAGGYNNTMSVSNPGPGTGTVVVTPPAPSGPVAVNNPSGTTATNPSGTTTLDVTNAGTYTNNGTNGNVTNTGTFTNNGTTGAVTNSGTLINAGTVASLVNTGTASNSGTITGSVTNTSGTFTNTGTAGDWTNSDTINNSGTMGNGTNNAGATFNNAGGGVVGNVSNSGTFANAGTIGTVTSSGAFINTGTAGAVILTDGTFSNTGTVSSVDNTAGLTFTNGGTVTGVLTNVGTVTNTGTVGSLANTGAYANSGTTGDWINNGVIANSGTMGNGTNYTLFANSGAVGAVNNQGAFANTGTLTSLTNSGTFTQNSGNLGLTAYTQTSTGSTVLTYGQQVAVNGTANLGGGLTILNGPTAYGKYPTFLSANSITGQYNSYTGPGVLKYTPTGISFWVMPDGTVVQAGMDNLASAMSSMNQLASGTMTGALGSDCASFGSNGGCVSVNYGRTRVADGDLNTAGVTVGKAVSANWRLGVYLSDQLNSPTLGGITYNGTNPSYGGFIGWNKNTNGTGLGVTASAITGRGNYTVGSDTTGVNARAYQIKGTYNMAANDTTNVITYLGVRKSSFTVNGYTEQGSVFPLTYGDVKQTATDALAGITVAKQFTNKVSGSASLGVVRNLSYDAGTLTSTSDMGNFTAPLPGSGYTSASAGTGLSYEVVKNQKLGLNIGWQQKSLINNSIASYGLSYTVGF